MPASIGTAVHLHPPGTSGELCRAHNRAALATVVAAIARRQGYGPELTDEQIDDCRAAAKEKEPRQPASEATRAAVRSALAPPLTEQDSAEAIAAAVFSALPDSPLRVTGSNGQEFYLVPIPVTP